MTRDPFRAAKDNGHRMRSSGEVGDRSMYRCSDCAALLVVDKENPYGFGSALERECMKDKAA